MTIDVMHTKKRFACFCVYVCVCVCVGAGTGRLTYQSVRVWVEGHTKGTLGEGIWMRGGGEVSSLCWDAGHGHSMLPYDMFVFYILCLCPVCVCFFC